MQSSETHWAVFPPWGDTDESLPKRGKLFNRVLKSGCSGMFGYRGRGTQGCILFRYEPRLGCDSLLSFWRGLGQNRTSPFLHRFYGRSRTFSVSAILFSLQPISNQNGTSPSHRFLVRTVLGRISVRVFGDSQLSAMTDYSPDFAGIHRTDFLEHQKR